MENKDAVPETPKKKGLPLIAKIGIGCLIVFVLLIVLVTVAGGLIWRRVSQNLNIDTVGGKVTYTDPKTGAKVDIGSGEIPKDFPKDFPVYPGSKVTASLSGTEKAQSGFWLTLSTPDSTDKVRAYYETQLAANGWDVTDGGAQEGATGVNWVVTKGKLSGYVTVAAEASSEKQTTILIVLGETENK